MSQHLFIVGSARTGSTLLRHVLNRSPQVCLASETHFFRWSRAVHLQERLAAAGSDGGPDAVRQLAGRFLQPDFWIWLRRNVSLDEFAERLRATDLSEGGVFALLIELYAERRCQLDLAGVRGEKTPGHLPHVPRLMSWFPDARVIHTFRDPRAIYASQLRRLREGRWGPKARWPWLPGAVVDPLLAPAEAWRTAGRWRRAARLHRRYQAEYGPRYRLLRFEDLVHDPEGEVRAICDFIGIDYRADMLEGTDVIGSSFEARRHAGAGFDAGALARWRTELRPLAKRWFSMAVGTELQRFGYER